MNTGLKLKMHDKIKEALLEDITYKDASVEGIFDEESIATADLIAKEDGVLCGVEVFEEVFKILDKDSDFKFNKKEGEILTKGELIATVKSKAQEMLLAERTALNFLQRMSGIATATKKMVETLGDRSIQLADTRKTAPGLRIFDKYSVMVGGGSNHRFNLSDTVMLKDNHISGAGGIKSAVEKVRQNNSFTTKIEVEAENIEQVKEAIESKCDIIMLDNMSEKEIDKSIELIDSRAMIEVSGNISIDSISKYRGKKIDIISCGELTHSVKVLDISLKNMKIEG
ncbi:carboxylating nicotinate-nucleotide diphosphorylase [Peptostreptococcus faecalis]|uniref:carboxylating nicotinate-nucleotide diphosphorylase n=1 Tax=Peptostreptococcus faecalis TaxID=2045015 RepID=UPI000C799942|nr:carboxylating nicotinate-nucleotide diphosphorylase [Peptostreptococcus faecalis]